MLNLNGLQDEKNKEQRVISINLLLTLLIYCDCVLIMFEHEKVRRESHLKKPQLNSVFSQDIDEIITL